MGLDITAYRRLSVLDVADVEFEDEEEDYALNAMKLYDNPDFPGRIGSLDAGAFYDEGEESFSFRAGSYSGHSAFRRDLENLTQYSAEAVDSGPFYELLWFSDCEGTIGPEVSAKLYQDFVDFDERAATFNIPDHDWFYSKYNDWKRAFKLAADGGAVVFH